MYVRHKTEYCRAEGALSIESPENIVENTSVLKIKNSLVAFSELVRVTLTKRFVSGCIEGLPVDK